MTDKDKEMMMSMQEGRGFLKQVQGQTQLQERYKSEELVTRILTEYNPDSAVRWVAKPIQAFMVKSPSLARLNAISENADVRWMSAEFISLALWLNIDVSDAHVVMGATMFAKKYYYLKLSELQLFFAKLKMGEYGRLYGRLDFTLIGEAMKKFMGERNTAYDYIDRKREEKKREEERREAIVFNEERRKKLLAVADTIGKAKEKDYEQMAKDNAEKLRIARERYGVG